MHTRRSGVHAAASMLAAFAFAADAYAEHDFVETELSCGMRCALGAIALLAEKVYLPELDPEALHSMPANGRSLAEIRAFLRQHGISAEPFSNLALTNLRPTGGQPAILQLSPEWSKRTNADAVTGLHGVDYEDGDNPHFVLAVDREGTALLIWDVTVETELVPMADLQPYYSGTGMHLTAQSRWMRIATTMSARRELWAAGGTIVIASLGLLAFQRRKNANANAQ